MDTECIEKIPGACVTDVLFDPDYKRISLEKIHTLVPEARGKKLIVYMPTPRRRKNSGDWLELLDIEYLAEKLIGEYFMLIDLRNNNTLANACKNTVNVPGFSRNISKEKISLRNMLVSADIVIGDYRDTFFESALLGVPVYSTAVDMEDIQSSSQNLAYDLREMYPFPIIRREEDLLYSLDNKGKYDFDSLNFFKSKYLDGCNGRIAERIKGYIEERIMEQ